MKKIVLLSLLFFSGIFTSNSYAVCKYDFSATSHNKGEDSGTYYVGVIAVQLSPYLCCSVGATSNNLEWITVYPPLRRLLWLMLL